MRMIGRINRIELHDAMGGHDMRAVAFLQGCDLRCVCCKNPQIWSCAGGEEITAKELAEKLMCYRPYFGVHGGITITGGEALLQAEFVEEIFKICKEKGIHTKLETSGDVCSAAALRVLDYADLVLLDIKYTTREDYRAYARGSLRKMMRFLNVLQVKKIPVWLRQTIIPGLNDDNQNLDRLAEIANDHPCVERVELQPHTAVDANKYKQLGILYALKNTPPLDTDTMKRLEKYLEDRLKSANKPHCLLHFNHTLKAEL